MGLMSPRTAGAPQWLEPHEMVAWRTFIETVGDLTAALDADLRSTGLTIGDYQVLVKLSEAPERQMRMCDLAEVLQLSPSGLTRRLDGLVRVGWVARQGSTQDRRVMMAVLTDSGFAKLAAAAPVHVASVRRRIFDHLSPEQVHALGTTLGAIRNALVADGG
jgi:DNA-binding MarR family transcriptional regulator